MNIKEAVQVLREHNEWRRGNKAETWGRPPYSPAQIGQAIDVVCNHYEEQLGMVATDRKYQTVDPDAEYYRSAGNGVTTPDAMLAASQQAAKEEGR